ncbi:MAG: hypothetical protein QXS32_09195 [Candidatus Nezhaarchaeales archaeon]
MWLTNAGLDFSSSSEGYRPYCLRIRQVGKEDKGRGRKLAGREVVAVITDIEWKIDKFGGVAIGPLSTKPVSRLERTCMEGQSFLAFVI